MVKKTTPKPTPKPDSKPTPKPDSKPTPKPNSKPTTKPNPKSNTEKKSSSTLGGGMFIVKNPLVQEFTMSIVKDLLSSFSDKNKNKDKKELEELKKKVESLTAEKDMKNSQILQNKDIELGITLKRNQHLYKEIQVLKKQMEKIKNENDMSTDFEKEKDKFTEKIAGLEKEMSGVMAEKIKKEKEIEEMKKLCDNQKENNKELNDLIIKFAKLINPEAASTSSKSSNEANLNQEECISKMLKLMEKASINLDQPSDKNDKKKKINQKQSQVQNQRMPEHYRMHPHHFPGPSGSQYMPGAPYYNEMHNTPGPSNPAMFRNVSGYPVMVDQMNNPSYPYQQNIFPPQFSGAPVFMNSPPHAVHQATPSSLNYKPPLLPTPPNQPPPLLPNNIFVKDGNKPYISNKPGGIGNQIKGKKNFDKPNRVEQQEKKNSAQEGGKKDKSGVSYDLWSQLENLKEEIKRKNSSRTELCSQVTSMMANYSNSSIASKEKFMDELTGCLKSINELPEDKPNYNSSAKSRNNIPNEKSSQENGNRFKNSRGRGNFANRNRCNFNAGIDKNKDRNELLDNNDNSDDNDDVSSQCSDQSFKGNRGRGRGGFMNKGRGQFKRFRNTRSLQSVDNSSNNFNNPNFKPQHSQNKKVVNLETNQEPKENVEELINMDEPIPDEETEQNNVLDPDSTNAEPDNQIDSKKPKSKLKNKKKKKNLVPMADLLLFDDSIEENLEDSEYANDEFMKMFTGSNIPKLMDAIINKIDVTKKVKNHRLVATKDGTVINEVPFSILDIIQFKEMYPDGICLKDV